MTGGETWHDPHPSSAVLAFSTASELLGTLGSGELTSESLTDALIERIEALDGRGPQLHSIISLHEGALDEARRLDAERRSSKLRGPLHGLPVLVKDNIDTAGALGTTAGSYALATSPPRVDATLVSGLRAAGAIILGKTNLSEWANFRGRVSSSGWSAVGGQCRNPHGLDRSPGGSSAGSGAAVAAGFAPFGIGTETDGSILCPAAACGIVGLKPTVGLVSRAGIVPISPSQDTAGPMARSVSDVALLLEVLAAAGTDRRDAATFKRPPASPAVGGYIEAARRSPAGLRVGIARGEGFSGYHLPTDEAAEVAYEALRAAGVELVDPVGCERANDDDELLVLKTEFKSALEHYLAKRGGGSGSALWSLAEVVAFNEANAAERLDLFGQDLLVESAAAGALDDPGYLAAQERNWRRTRKDGIDAACERHGIKALVAPTMPPSWLIDHVNGDAHSAAAWGQAAVAGYPSITVPVGLHHGLPVAVALWGPAWSEATLLSLAAAIERGIGPGPPPSWRGATGLLA